MIKKALEGLKNFGVLIFVGGSFAAVAGHLLMGAWYSAIWAVPAMQVALIALGVVLVLRLILWVFPL